MRVRIVEDEHDIALMLEVALGFYDIQIVNSNAAFDTLLQNKPWEDIDGAIIDLNLAGIIQGEHILEYLRENHPNIRRVVLSASAEHMYDLQKQDHTLAHAWFLKPTDIANIAIALGAEEVE